MRINKEFKFKDYAFPIKGYCWSNVDNPKACIVIFHGMAEYVLRYDDLANYLSNNEYVVYAFDFVGHGYSKLESDKVGYVENTTNLINLIIECQKEIFEFVRKEVPNLPIHLFAHSLSSMIAQRYIEIYPNDFDKVILSGPDTYSFKYGFLSNLIKHNVKKKGYNRFSETVHNLGVGAFDKKFKKENLQNSWLSNNIDNVTKYNADPLCGEKYPIGYYYSLACSLKESNKFFKDSKASAILVMSGELDPVSNFGKNAKKLNDKYKKINLNSSLLIIKGARHETFNESEPLKSEVYNEIKKFFD